MAKVHMCLKDSVGGALVELALVLPVLILLLLGAAEFGMIEYATIEVSNAALAGVQYGAQSVLTSGDTQGISNAAAADASNLTLGPTTSSVSYICSDGSTTTCQGATPTTAVEQILTVQTQATVRSIVTIPGLPPTFTVHGQAIQKVL